MVAVVVLQLSDISFKLYWVVKVRMMASGITYKTLKGIHVK